MLNMRFLLPLAAALPLSACAGGGGGTPWEGSPSQAMFYQGLSMMSQRPAYVPPAAPAMPRRYVCSRNGVELDCRARGY